MTLEDLKREISTCLRAGPSGWTKAATQLQPAAKYIVSSARSKQPLHERRMTFMARYGAKLIAEDESVIRDFFTHAVDLLQAQIFGQRDYREARTKEILQTWPAAELTIGREEPDGWRERWVAAGGTIKNGRAFAAKDSAAWARFNEFGHPFEPFDWGNSFRVEDASRSDFSPATPRSRPSAPQSVGGDQRLVTSQDDHSSQTIQIVASVIVLLLVGGCVVAMW